MNTVTLSPTRRIQRRRTYGWFMPPDGIYVGRPSLYGNPFTWERLGRAGATDHYRKWLVEGMTFTEMREVDLFVAEDAYELLVQRRLRILEHLPRLRGHHLACWCPLSEPCHADVLVERCDQ